MKRLEHFLYQRPMGRTVPGRHVADLIDPATETQTGKLAMGTAEDADRAVAAARAAFPAWSESSREERIALLERHHRSVSRAPR